MKVNNHNFDYLFRHWIFTLLLGPILFQSIIAINDLPNCQISSLLPMYPIAIIVGFAISIPTCIIYAFVYNYLSNRSIAVLYKKAILISIPVIGIFITMALIKGTIWFQVALSYSITSIIVGLFFRLNFRSEEEEF